VALLYTSLMPVINRSLMGGWVEEVVILLFVRRAVSVQATP